MKKRHPSGKRSVPPPTGTIIGLKGWASNIQQCEYCGHNVVLIQGDSYRHFSCIECHRPPTTNKEEPQ